MRKLQIGSLCCIVLCSIPALLSAQPSHSQASSNAISEPFTNHLVSPNSLGYDDILLLSNELIVTDLGLSTTQKQSIGKTRERFGECIKQNHQERTSILQEHGQDQYRVPFRWLSRKEVNAEYSRRLDVFKKKACIEAHAVLTSEQKNRLGQIKLHLVSNAVYHNELFREQVGISNEQYQMILELFSTIKQKIVAEKKLVKMERNKGLNERHTYWNNRAFEEALELLSTEQQELIRSIRGKKPGYAAHDVYLKVTFSR